MQQGLHNWRSKFKTNESFLELANYIGAKNGQPPFANTTDAENWLNSQGYFSSYDIPTPTPSPTSTLTPTPTGTLSITPTPTGTPESTSTPTPSVTNTQTPTATITETPTNTPTLTQTPTSTDLTNITTYTISGCTSLNEFVANLGPGALAPGDIFYFEFTGGTPSGCYRIVNKINAVPTDGTTPLYFYTSCALCVAAREVTPTPTVTQTPTVTPTNTETPTNTPTPSVTNTQTPTTTTTLTATETETPTPTPTTTETPTQTPSNTSTSTPTNTPTPTSTPLIVPENGLVLYLDAGDSNSYSGTGNQWFDISGNNNTGTLQNSPTYSSSDGGTLSFNGSSQYVTFNTPANIPLGNSNYTISVWFNANSLGSGGFVGWGGYGATNQVTALRLTTTGLNHYWWGNDLIIDTPISLNTWYYVVARFNGTNREIWLNNVKIANDTPGSSHNVTQSTNLTVGRTYTNEYFNGKLSNLEIYNRAISDAEMTEIYNDYYNRFFPTPTPTNTQTSTPTPSVTNTQTPTRTSSTPTPTATLTQTPSPTPYTTLAGSLLFNGSNQSLGISPGVTFGAGTFTLEGWFYNTSDFNSKGIIGSPVSSPTGCMNLYFANGTTITSDRNGGGGSFSYTMSSSITANQWHYLIYNRNADGTTAVYIDGVRCTATSLDTLNYTTATDTIGRYYGGYWPGYWTNMRMTIGTAVYNSNLTTQSTPRGPLTSLANTKYLMLGAVVTTDSSGTQTVTNNNGVTQTSDEPF